MRNENQVALCQIDSKGPCLWVFSHHVQNNNCKINKLIPISKQYVAPVYLNNQQSGYHEWLIEFNEVPENIEDFEIELDKILKKLNSDYDAKRFNNLLLSNLKVKVLPKDSFYKWLKSKNKLGGQNKVPKLCNDRIIADEILKISHDS